MAIRQRPGKTFYRNLISICIVFVLATILLLPVYALAIRSANERSVSAIQYTLDTAAANIDAEALTLLAMNDQLNDQAIYHILNSADEDFTPALSYKLLKCRSLFKMLIDDSDVAFEYMWLFSNNSRVIAVGESDTAYDTYTDCFDKYVRYVGISSQVMRQNVMYTSRQLTMLAANEVILNGFSQGQCITLVAHPLNRNSVFCALYRLSDIKTVFGLDTLPAETFLTYSTYDGAEIFNTGTGEDIGKKTVLTAEMPILGGTMSIHVPDTYFSSQVATVRGLLQFYFGMAVFFGAVLAIITAIFNYQSMYKLIRSVSDENPFTGKKLLDEYAFLKELDIKSKNQQKEMIQQMSTMRRSIRSVHLERLLMNALPAKQENIIIEKYLPELSGSCRLAIIDIGYDRSEAEAEDIIVSILPRFEKNDLHITYMGYGQIYTLFSNNTLMNFEETFADANEIIRSHYGTKACATISNVFTGTEGLRQAFRSVQITAITSIHSLGYAQDIETDPKLLPTVDLKVLCQAVHAGSSQAAEHFIVNSLNELLEKNGSYDDVVKLYDTLRSRLITIASELGTECDVAGFVPNTPILEQFEMLGMAGSMLSDKQDRKKAVPAYKNEMLDYIESNYSDANMYAGSIAEHFNVSTKQVYRVVRELTGTGFSDYLEDLRIKQAVRLLDETDIVVNDIAIKCGFNSVSTFYRAFKRVHGVTPTLYRTRDNN